MNSITWCVQTILIVGVISYFIVPWARKHQAGTEMPPVGGTPFVGLVILMMLWLMMGPLTAHGLSDVFARFAVVAGWFVAFMLNLALARKHWRLKTEI